MAIKLKAIQKFESIKKMGGNETSRMYLKELILELDELLAKYYQNNQFKMSSTCAKTPLTLICLIFSNYILASLFGFIWMTFISSVFKSGFYISLIFLLFWSFSKYTGQYKEINFYIDNITIFFWDNVSLFLKSIFLN